MSKFVKFTTSFCLLFLSSFPTPELLFNPPLSRSLSLSLSHPPPPPPPKVRDVILSSTSVGARHRDHLVTGNVAGGVGDALVEHFFGPDKKGKLTVDMFRSFHRMLRTELLWLEVRPHPLATPPHTYLRHSGLRWDHTH